MYMILGLTICILGFGWIKFGPYFQYGGWIIIMIGAILIAKGRKKMGLKNE